MIPFKSTEHNLLYFTIDKNDWYYINSLTLDIGFTLFRQGTELLYDHPTIIHL